jgi:hypothetical protein
MKIPYTGAGFAPGYVTETTVKLGLAGSTYVSESGSAGPTLNPRPGWLKYLIQICVFSAPVGGALASMTISWAAPVGNADGSQPADIAGYRVSWGTTSGFASGIYASTHNVAAGTLTYTVSGIAAGTYYTAVQTLNTAGIASEYSPELAVVAA